MYRLFALQITFFCAMQRLTSAMQKLTSAIYKLTSATQRLTSATQRLFLCEINPKCAISSLGTGFVYFLPSKVYPEAVLFVLCAL